MKYISSSQAAALWGISARRVSLLASQGRIKGAAFTGYTWLIPENARKPADSRKKAVKEAADNASHISPYPINAVYSDEQLLQFSPEEAELYRASVLHEAGDFAEGRKCAEALLRSGVRMIRLGALYQLVFDCLYLLDFDAVNRYSVLFLSEYHSVEEHGIEEKLLLHAFEMELGRTSAVLDSIEYTDALSISRIPIPAYAYMKLYTEAVKFTHGGSLPDICLYGLLCRQIETSGYFYCSLHLNLLLSVLFGTLGRPEHEMLYARRAVEIAAEHDIVSAVAAFLSISPDVLEEVLCDLPSDYSDRVHKVNERMSKARAGFSASQQKHNACFNLSAEDCRLISYCSRNYTNEQMAELFGLSRSGMNKRLASLYRKLRVNSKKDLIRYYLDFLYDWNS